MSDRKLCVCLHFEDEHEGPFQRCRNYTNPPYSCVCWRFRENTEAFRALIVQKPAPPWIQPRKLVVERKTLPRPPLSDQERFLERLDSGDVPAVEGMSCGDCGHVLTLHTPRACLERVRDTEGLPDFCPCRGYQRVSSPA